MPKTITVNPAPKLMVEASEAAEMYGIGRSLFLQADKLGQVPASIRIGARRLWAVEELAAHVRHGCPSRNEWSRIWAKIVVKTEGFSGNRVLGRVGGEVNGQPVPCGAGCNGGAQ